MVYSLDEMGSDNCLEEMKDLQDKNYLEKKKKQETQKEQMLYGNGESLSEKEKKRKDYNTNKLNENFG